MSTLTFDPIKHVYKLDGKRLTSVTTVLGAGIPKPQLIDWAARTAADFAVANPNASWEQIATAHKTERDTAAVRGTAVHNLAEQLVHGEAVEVPAELEPYIDGYLNFLDAFQITPLLTEKTVCLPWLNVAGRFDLIGTSPFLNQGKPCLFDVKTSKGVYRETRAQLAAYSKADYWVDDNEPDTQNPLPKIEATYVIHVTPEGTNLHPFAPNPAGIEDDFAYFINAYSIYKGTLAAYKVKEPIPYPTQEMSKAS
jgi:hypothetical protein